MARPSSPRTTALAIGGGALLVGAVLSVALVRPLARMAGLALATLGGVAIGLAAARRAPDARRDETAGAPAVAAGGRAPDLDALLALFPIPVCVSLDPAGRSVRLNAAMAQLLGVAEDPAARFRLLRDGVEIPAEELPMQRCAATGQPVEDLELEVEHADGSVRSLLASARPLRAADGSLRGYLGVCMDVTGRKRLERTLRHRSDSLEREDRNKDAFLATLAHELRNPLGAIANAVEILCDETAFPPASAGARALGILQRQVEQAVRLADDLLDLERIRHGKIEIALHPIRLDTVVERALEAARAALDEAGIELRVGELAPVWVRGDEARLAQVLANLLANACRHTPRGGLVTVALAVAGGEARVSVRDTGSGMPPAVAERAFEPFHQGAGGRGQLGLGLAIARTIVEHHGGRIEAHSDGLGKGTQVLVRIPVAERAVRSLGPLAGAAPGGLAESAAHAGSRRPAAS